MARRPCQMLTAGYVIDGGGDSSRADAGGDKQRYQNYTFRIDPADQP